MHVREPLSDDARGSKNQQTRYVLAPRSRSRSTRR